MTAEPHIAGDIDGFLDTWEVQLTRTFLAEGRLILPVADTSGLKKLRDRIAGVAAEHLGLPPPEDPGAFLDGVHRHVEAAGLDALRLRVIDDIAGDRRVRRTFFGLARRALETLVGNELAMQKRINLSVQLPGDASSLLHVHADVWDGDSPFEVVAWLPLVDCYRTKSMFLLPPAAGGRIEAAFGHFQGRSADALYEAVKADVEWLDVPYGSVLLFTQNLLHGNRVNKEPETRWTLNCRFKSLFSPYAGKRLGEFFEPITIRAATRFGMSYALPEGLHE